MIIYAVDPGTQQSALATYDSADRTVLATMTISNEAMVDHLGGVSVLQRPMALVVEKIEAMGMAVGASTFETVWWAGRFHEAWPTPLRHRVTRREVKLHLCRSMRAKDANIRQAILDRYGSTREVAIGNKKNPGPLYGVVGHEFAALAVAITFAETVLES